MSRQNILYVIFITFALILYLGNTEQRLQKARFLSKTLYLPLISSVNIVENLFKVKEENQLLVKEIANKTIYINNLENQLDMFEKIKVDYIFGHYDFCLADIIGYRGDFKERNFILNKGSIDDIKINYPVISSEGIIGKILSVSLNYAIVLPYTHSKFKLGVMLEKNNLQGMLESDIYGNTYMRLIKLGSDINLGDTVVTSNISSIFPRDFPVGVVTRLIESPDKIHMDAKISGFTNPASLDQVIVLEYKKDKNYEKEFDNRD